MIRPILLWPKEADKLHRVSAPILANDIKAGNHDELVRDLFDTMFDANGVGLSAIQIDVPFRLFVMEATGQDYVFFNPVIIKKTGGQELKNEGCLSLPGIYERVKRYKTIEVHALDRNGEPFMHTFSDIEAQCVQHEIEHLEGIIMPDKITASRREIVRKKMEKRDA